jgi:hypothetical protein
MLVPPLVNFFVFIFDLINFFSQSNLKTISNDDANIPKTTLYNVSEAFFHPRKGTGWNASLYAQLEFNRTKQIEMKHTFLIIFIFDMVLIAS